MMFVSTTVYPFVYWTDVSPYGYASSIQSEPPNFKEHVDVLKRIEALEKRVKELEAVKVRKDLK